MRGLNQKMKFEKFSILICSTVNHFISSIHDDNRFYFSNVIVELHFFSLLISVSVIESKLKEKKKKCH